VTRGTAFAAVAGTSRHGLEFLEDALARGALAVLHDAADANWTDARADRCRAAGAVAVPVHDLARRLGTIAARFHGHPSEAFEHVIAVTGTDGKTSVTHFVASMLDDGDAPAGIIGTLGAGRPGRAQAMGLTTPDAVGTQAAFAELRADGVRRVALEASSHGLAQYRLDGSRIDVATLTQLGRDHLDYHGSAEAYAEAKARLFSWPGLKAVVTNAEDAFGRRIREGLDAAVESVTYGHGRGDLRCRGIEREPAGMRLSLAWTGRTESIRVPLLGRFNADNVLAAAATLLALGFGLDDVVSRLARVRPVPGRMELFTASGRPGLVVDYAHTAGALRAALEALREHAPGRVWCIFGAGGDRDRGKRPLMGAAAAAADRVIITDDNPRSEDPATIVADIVAGIPAGTDFRVEHDRQRALARALDEAGPDDLVLLAGKGHESTQCRAEGVVPWSDRDAAADALRPEGDGP
jgi:UDP-N-acetylmuramoyl-L-alanyl-D-glutamate--2,6-diaminopimelate ligase